MCPPAQTAAGCDSLHLLDRPEQIIHSMQLHLQSSSLFDYDIQLLYLSLMDADLFLELLKEEKLFHNVPGWRSSDCVWANVALRMNLPNTAANRKLLYCRWHQNWKGVRDKMLPQSLVSSEAVTTTSTETFQLPFTEWQKIAPDMSHKRLQLQPDWTNVLFDAWNCDCQIRFKTKRINRCKLPFIRIQAHCSYSACSAHYNLTILTPPEPGKDCEIVVTRDGSRYLQPHRYRPVRGEVRQKLASELQGKSCTEYHYIQYAKSPIVSSVSALKKMKSEAALQSRNDVDPWLDLRQENEKHPDYIQLRSESPFAIHLYSYASMRLLHELSTRDLVLYIDATGGVVKKLIHDTSKKPVYYYAVVVKKESVTVPVAELITSSHIVPNIFHFFSTWLHCVKHLFPSFHHSKAIVVDQSFCLLNSAAQAFTERKNIWQYLEMAFVSISHGTELPKPHIYLCCAHLIHCFVRHLKSSGLIKEGKDFIIRCLTIFMRLSSFNEVQLAAHHLFNLLLTKSRRQTEESLKYFQKHLANENSSSDCVDTEANPLLEDFE